MCCRRVLCSVESALHTRRWNIGLLRPIPGRPSALPVMKITVFSLVSWCRGHPLVGVKSVYKKSVGICIGYRPTNRGFSHCPVKVGLQRRSPTLVYAINASGYIPLEISCRKQDNYISTRHLPLLNPWLWQKFCENFDSSRISADKRFSLCLHPAHCPSTGASERSALQNYNIKYILPNIIEKISCRVVS